MNCFLEIQKKKEEFRKLLKVFLSLGISYTFIIQKWVPVDLLEVVESEIQWGIVLGLLRAYDFYVSSCDLCWNLDLCWKGNSL